uniref:N-acetylglucosamine kinase n=1 Tax=Candidatus Fimivicinus sp. TaxID=3056640 RepID=UPI003FF115B5
MSYYIGVDGGGTKTTYALFNETKRLLGSLTGKGSNHENMAGGIPQAAGTISEGLHALLHQEGKTQEEISFLLMGLAGIDHPYQHDAMCGELQARGWKHFEIYNDGFIVVKAGASGPAAIGYNTGTGTCCNAIDSRGNRMQLGGLGNATADKGNSVWITEQVFRIVYDDVFLHKRESLLTKLYYQAFSISSRDEFLSTIAQAESGQADAYFHTLTDLFFEAVAQRDKAALETLNDMAERGSDLIAALANQMDFDSSPIEVVLSGSMHTKLAPVGYRSLLQAKSELKSGRAMRFLLLDRPPVYGCINWILERKEGKGQ